jgi:hypothetical protein
MLRLVAMVSVFAAHAAQPFNPWDVWHVQSPDRSKWLGELVLFLAPWVMPLFVLLAGASAWHSLGKRSTREYLNERVTRLVVPLIAGVLLVVPPQVYFDRRQHGLFDGSFVQFYPHFFEGIYPTGNFAWSHLWFLAVLALLALITLPLFRWLQSTGGRRVMSWLSVRASSNGALLLPVVPMLVVRAALCAAFPHSRPVVTDWTNRTTLLVMFVYGFMLEGEPGFMRAVDRQWRVALAVAIAFSAAAFAWAWPGDFTQRFPVPFTLTYVLTWSAFTLGGWVWCIALLGAVRTMSRGSEILLERTRPLLNPFYVLHQTVIVALAFYLIPLKASPGATFLTLFVSAFGSTAVLAVLAGRSRLTRALLGIRQPAPPRAMTQHGIGYDDFPGTTAQRLG